MLLAIDTDAFCKLGGFGLLPAACAGLRARIDECCRLPRLTRQIERATWLRGLDAGTRASLMDLAQSMHVVSPAPGGWIDRLAELGVPFDAGEAALFSLVADGDASLVVTGDKRAIRLLAQVPELAPLLVGKVVTVESAALIALDVLGDAAVNELVHRPSAYALDPLLGSCLRAPDRRAALKQYVQGLREELAAELLWNPTEDGP